MGLLRFLKVQSTDPAINRMQDNILKAVNPLVLLCQQALLQGQIIPGVVLKASPTTPSGYNEVPVSLGRKVTGWFPVRVRAKCTLWDAQDSNTTYPTSLLYLETSADSTVDLLVF